MAADLLLLTTGLNDNLLLVTGDDLLLQTVTIFLGCVDLDVALDGATLTVKAEQVTMSVEVAACG